MKMRRLKRPLSVFLALVLALGALFSNLPARAADATPVSVAEWVVANQTYGKTVSATGGANKDGAALTTAQNSDITYAGDYSGMYAATGWYSGDGDKYWQISLSTAGYYGLTLAFRPSGNYVSVNGTSYNAPGDWKVQYSTDGTHFTEIINSSYKGSAGSASPSISLPADASDCATLVIRLVPYNLQSVPSGADPKSELQNIKFTGTSVQTPPTADKTALQTAVSAAQAKYDAAVIGPQPGEYYEAQSAKDALKAAIDAANVSLSGTYATQAQVDASATAFSSILYTLEKAQVREDGQTLLANWEYSTSAKPAFTTKKDSSGNLNGNYVNANYGAHMDGAQLTGGGALSNDQPIPPSTTDGALFNWNDGYQAIARNYWRTSGEKKDAYWAVQFSTKGLRNVHLTAKAGSYASGSSYGPANFKVQYSLDGTTFADIPGSNYQVPANKLASLGDILLPDAANDRDTVYVRLTQTDTSSPMADKGVTETGNSYINNIEVTGAPAAASVDKTALGTEISTASGKAQNAVVGTALGNYPQRAVDALNTAIAAAQAVANKADATQAEVDEATGDLKTAEAAFDAAVVKLGDKTQLNGDITAAQAKHDAAVVGTQPGNYKQGDVTALQTAIDAAKAVAGNAGATQTDVDAADITLIKAISDFETAVIPYTVAAWMNSSTITPGTSTQASATDGVNKAGAVLTTAQNAALGYTSLSSTVGVYTAKGWYQGSGEKYWQISLSTAGYYNIVLKAYIRNYLAATVNGVTYTAPTQWKAQYSRDGANFTDFQILSTPATNQSYNYPTLSLPAGASDCANVVVRLVPVNTSVSVPSSADPISEFGYAQVTGISTQALPTSDKTALTAAIAAAQAEHDAAVIGGQPGQYFSQSVKDALQTAVDLAKTTLNSAYATQTQLDNAVTAVQNAVAALERQKVGADGKLTAAQWNFTTTPAEVAGGNGPLVHANSGAYMESGVLSGGGYWSADKPYPDSTNKTGAALLSWQDSYKAISRAFWQTSTETLPSYWTVQFSTKNLQNLQFTANVGTLPQAPADFKVQYSLDGNTYTDISNGAYHISTIAPTPLVNVSLPADAGNQDTVYIRLLQTSTTGGNGSPITNETYPSYINNIAVIGTPTSGTVTVDKTQLNNDVTAAQALHDGATPGTQPGNYPQDAITAFQTAIDAAKAVANNAGATQAQVDSADDTLTAAVATFKGKQVPTGTTIAQVRAQGTGSVSFTGYVTRVVNGSTMYVQDSTAGIQIYGSGFDSSTYPEGTQVTVSGTLAKYPPTSAQPTLEVQSPVITKTGAPISKVPPVALDFATYSANYQKYEGTLISIQNVKLTSGKGATYGITDGSTSVDLYTKNGASVTPAMNTQVDVTGIATIYNNAPEIFFTTSTDIVPHGTVTVDKTALTGEIIAATGTLNGVTIGNDPGEYPQAAATAFQTAIQAAQAVADDNGATQAQVDQAVKDLKTAEDTFAKAKIPSTVVDKTQLNNDVTAAQTLHDGATPGTQPGNYPQDAITVFQTAIDAAKAVANNASATQAQVDTADGTLTAAVATFKGKQVPTGPTIAQVRAQGTGSVSFTGYVTRVVNGSTMYVQDSTAGIQIYGSGFDSSTYPEGTQVTVSGTLAKYPPTSAQPTLEVQSPVITKTGAPISKVPPVALDFATYSANYQKYEGTLISIQNVKLTSGKGATYGITDGSTSVDLYTKNGASVTPAMNTQVDVTGIATIYNNAPEIFFTTSTDIVPHGTVTVDKTALNSTIASAQALYDGAVVGDKAGNYPQSAKDTFGAAIDAAKAVAAKADATQADVDTATGDLNDAVTTFKATVITSQVDKTQLNSDLTSANGKVKDAVAGDQPGNYPPSAIDAYKTAIAAAQAVADKADATQAEVDTADGTLATAGATFDKAKIPAAVVDKSALNSDITAANAKVKGAVAGSQIGNYPQAAIDAYKAAIAAAQAVADKADATQTDVNNADSTLKAAGATFDKTIVTTAPTTTVTDSATGVQVTGTLPDDAQLVVNQITGGADYQKAKTALADVSGQYVLYDLSLLTQNGGVKWEPSNGNTVQISLPIPDGFDTSRLAVYYIADNGSKERISGKVVGDRYVFNASHLSQYALVETASSPSSQNPSSQTPSSQTPSSSTSSASNPKTGTDTLPAGAIVLFVGAAACAALMLGKRRRDR